MPQPILCHGHGGKVPHRRGADLHCSKECEAQHRAAQQLFEAALQDTGFSQVKETPNLWLKDGVHVSIEQVMREGFRQTLDQHRESVEARV